MKARAAWPSSAAGIPAHALSTASIRQHLEHELYRQGEDVVSGIWIQATSFPGARPAEYLTWGNQAAMVSFTDWLQKDNAWIIGAAEGMVIDADPAARAAIGDLPPLPSSPAIPAANATYDRLTPPKIIVRTLAHGEEPKGPDGAS